MARGRGQQQWQWLLDLRDPTLEKEARLLDSGRFEFTFRAIVVRGNNREQGMQYHLVSSRTQAELCLGRSGVDGLIEERLEIDPPKGARAMPITVILDDRGKPDRIIPVGSVRIPRLRRGLKVVTKSEVGDDKFEVYLLRTDERGNAAEGEIRAFDFVLPAKGTKVLRRKQQSWDANKSGVARIVLPRFAGEREVTFFLADDPDVKASVTIPAKTPDPQTTFKLPDKIPASRRIVVSGYWGRQKMLISVEAEDGSRIPNCPFKLMDGSDWKNLRTGLDGTCLYEFNFQTKECAVRVEIGNDPDLVWRESLPGPI